MPVKTKQSKIEKQSKRPLWTWIVITFVVTIVLAVVCIGGMLVYELDFKDNFAFTAAQKRCHGEWVIEGLELSDGKKTHDHGARVYSSDGLGSKRYFCSVEEAQAAEYTEIFGR